MPLHYGVLGLLAEEPGYGCQVRVKIEGGIGEQWGEGELQRLARGLGRAT
jgi:hypothetical protein